MKMRKHENHMSNDERIAILETTVSHINQSLQDMRQDIRAGFAEMNRRFEMVDRKFEAIDRKFEIIDHKFEVIDHKFDRLNKLIWSNFMWLISAMIALAGLIAHVHHWI